jgi:two-component system cell cycle response regulator DivK
MTSEISESDAVTILYIEDNLDNRTLIRRVLEAEGFIVLEAGNATEALRVFQYQIPDLILMDINMPDVDGYTFTKQLKHMPTFKQVPIIAITANAMKGDQERSFQAGCDAYIQKPVDIDHLSQQILGFVKV